GCAPSPKKDAAGFFLWLDGLPEILERSRSRVGRNVANVRQRCRPVFQIIRSDEGTLAYLPCPQPPGADFVAKLRGADGCGPCGFRNAVGNWLWRGICRSNLGGAGTHRLILLATTPVFDGVRWQRMHQDRVL